MRVAPARLSPPCARMDPNGGKYGSNTDREQSPQGQPPQGNTDRGNTVDHEVSEWLDRLGAATARLLATSASFTDAQLRQPPF